MDWHRGTEAPMDTSPAGPRKRSIFESQETPAPSLAPPSTPHSSQSHYSNAPFLFHCNPALGVQDTLADVEMSSLTPPHHHSTNPQTATADGGGAWVDEGVAEPHHASPSKHRTVSSAAVNRVRRQRSVQAKGARSRATGQMVVARQRGSRRSHRAYTDAATDDDDDDEDEDDDDDDEEDEEDDHGATSKRVRSITKYAVNYFLPGSGGGPTSSHGGHHLVGTGKAKAGRHGSSAATDGGGARGGVDHLDWPELLLGYAQFLFNASILGAFLYLLFSIVRTVQQDVAEKVRGYEMDTLSEITSCAASYSANRCGTDLQAPALASACQQWERCSARDPAVVGRARVTAETFAEILNGFVDVVSWKAMLFSLLTLSIIVGATNSTLSFFRIRSRKMRQRENDSRAAAAAAAAGQHAAQHPGYYGHHAAPPPLPPPWTMQGHPHAFPDPATPARKRIHRSQAGDEDAVHRG